MTLNDDELIDRYLSGDLPPEEQRTFGERLEQEAPLRRRVELREDLYRWHTSGEMNFSELVAGVGEDYFNAEPPAERPTEPPVETNRLSWYWWVLLALLAALGLALLFSQRGNSTPIVEETIDAPAVPLQRDTVVERVPLPVNSPDTVKTAPPAPTPPRSAPAASPTPTPPPANPGPEPEPEPAPVFAAADPSFFVPNPDLEELLGTTRGSTESGSELQITQAPVRADGSLPTSAIGQLSLQVQTATTAAELAVYSNDPADFLAGEALFIRAIAPGDSVALGGELRQAFSRPGLYYLLLIADNGTILASERLVIR